MNRAAERRRHCLAGRSARYQEFFRRRQPGDLLVQTGRAFFADLDPLLCRAVFEGGVARLRDPATLKKLLEPYVAALRDASDRAYAVEDDVVPCVMVYLGIGAITAAMTGLQPGFDAETSWLEPAMDWDRIDTLKFDPDNPWLQIALQVNRTLQELWDDDFLVLPFLHRSPLDAANGIRGSDLFLEMYTESGRVHRLVDWCADWAIAAERFLKEQAPIPAGRGTGSWGVWLPDGAVFVNGDPVGLISREMQPVFERPYTEKLFQATGGGFFHNHTMGLYQVDKVAETGGLLVQEFIMDHNCPNVPQTLLHDPAGRERILAASRKAPVMIDSILPAQVDELLPIVKEGRFILSVACNATDDAAAIVRKVRKASAFAP